jgi:hypothetical protein
MKATQQNLLEKQRQRMHELRDDATDIANTVADEVWGKFEVAVIDITAEAYMFEMAAHTRMFLSGLLAQSYGEAFARHVFGLFDRLGNDLCEAGIIGEACMNSIQLELTRLHKGLKKQHKIDDLIRHALERAEPGLMEILFFSCDPYSEAHERERRDNARRVRRNLLKLRGRIVEIIRNDTSVVIDAMRLAYVSMLDSLPRKVPLQDHGRPQARMLMCGLT